MSRSITSQLYAAARLSNDLRAARKGPSAYAKRRIRRRVYRSSGSATRSLLRVFGLSR